MRISVKEYKEILAGKNPEKKTRFKTICPDCNKPIKENDSFSCQVVESTDPVEVVKKHLRCGLKK